MACDVSPVAMFVIVDFEAAVTENVQGTEKET